jgi:hypothetical protein
MTTITTVSVAVPKIILASAVSPSTLAAIEADLASAKLKAVALSTGVSADLALAKNDLAIAQAKIAATEGPVLTFIKANYTKLVFALAGAVVVFLVTRVF